MVQGALTLSDPVRSLSFTREAPTIIDIIKRHFFKLVMAREGRREKPRQKQSKKNECACCKEENHHAVCDCIYTRVPDMLKKFLRVLNFVIFSDLQIFAQLSTRKYE